MVVAQLEERSLPTLRHRQTLYYLFTVNCIENTKIKEKEAEIGAIFKLCYTGFELSDWLKDFEQQPNRALYSSQPIIFTKVNARWICLIRLIHVFRSQRGILGA